MRGGTSRGEFGVPEGRPDSPFCFPADPCNIPYPKFTLLALDQCPTTPKCDDGIDCTEDTCHPVTGDCTNKYVCEPAFTVIEPPIVVEEFEGPGNCQNCYQPCWGSAGLGCEHGPREMHVEVAFMATDYDCFGNEIGAKYEFLRTGAGCADACGYCGCGGLTLDDLRIKAETAGYELLETSGYEIGYNDNGIDELCKRDSNSLQLIQSLTKVNNSNFAATLPIDTDRDGIFNWLEINFLGTNPFDDDTDDDGLLDGFEDKNRNGRVDIDETNPLMINTDNDSEQDGTELGLTSPQGNDTNLDLFEPDDSPGTTSNPLFNDELGLPIFPQSITANARIEFRPRTDGRYIVWHERRSGNWDIFAFDLGPDGLKGTDDDGGEIQITNDDAEQINPSIHAGMVVWEDTRGGPREIYLFNLSSRAEISLTNSGFNKKQPSIYGNYIAFEDYSHRYNTFPDIVVMDWRNNVEVFRVEGDYFKHFPQISEHRVIWQDKRDGNWDIYYYDINQNIEVKLDSMNSFDQKNPWISGSAVVWEDYSSDNVDICFYDIDSNLFACVVTEGNQTSPKVHSLGMDQYNLVWLDDRNGNWDIYKGSILGDPASISETPFISNFKNQLDLDLKSDLVVWRDDTYGFPDIRSSRIDAFDLPTSIDDPNETSEIPQTFRITANYPNPFNPVTKIDFGLPQSTDVSIIIYDILGRKVRTLLSERKQAGSYTVTWNGKNDSGNIVATGIFLLQIKTEHNMEIIKMTFLK